MILFDALGTLVALLAPAPRLRVQLAERFGIEVSAAQAERALGAEIAYYRAHLGEGTDAATLGALRRNCAEVLRAALLGAVQAVASLDTDELTDALLASLEFKAFPDVGPALAGARARGRRLVVVSNWDASLPQLLARLELAPLVDGIVTSAQVGVAKPSPLIFERALELAGAGPDDAIHVGDSVEEDVAGARAAGIEPVLLRRDAGSGPPGVRTIATLAHLL